MNLRAKIAVIMVIVTAFGVGVNIYFNMTSTSEPTGKVLAIAKNKDNEALKGVNVKARNYTTSGWVSVSEEKRTGINGQAVLELRGLSKEVDNVTVFFWKEDYYSENVTAEVVRNGQLEPEKAAEANLWKTGSINIDFLSDESDDEISYDREDDEIIVKEPSSPSKSLEFSYRIYTFGADDTTCLRNPIIVLEDLINKNYAMVYNYKGDAKVEKMYSHGDKVLKFHGNVIKTIEITVGFKYSKAKSTDISINDLLGGEQFGEGKGAERKALDLVFK